MKSRNRVLYYGKKAAAFLASVLLLSVLVFYISRLAPGDPLVSYYGDRVEKMTPEERAWAEEKLGLKDPISVQYIRWAGNALHGDFGISYKYKNGCNARDRGKNWKYAGAWRHWVSADFHPRAASWNSLCMEGRYMAGPHHL